ncbi:hypothetical protein PEBR_22169 [Penicillium brasilianum]|uniref:Uncharacterized protein n=1 Tax=Penicillium brasilianum TaxID=104259 RepID=A0A1S9RMZ4_PENBI|nr:hypothetical protein PEBR_22169 [Penicillium brasilianum]
MAILKEGMMACARANVTRFTSELIQRKNACANLLTEHNLRTPDVIWEPKHGEGYEPFTAGDKAKFKLVTTVTYENGKLVWPPKFTRLSDELVYLATKFLKVTERAANYPYDFNERGDIREERVPSGVSPIVWAHGLPFFPVFKGYYILCGREHARWVGWLLNKKEHRIMVACPMWTIGPVIAPGSAVNLPRTVDRQMQLHVPKSAKEVDKKWEKIDSARDVVSTAHHMMSVVPKTPSKGFILAPIYHIDGYHVRCGPTSINGGKGLEIGRRTLSNHGVKDFDYDASLKKPYVNEENPAAMHSDDSDESEEEEDSNGTEAMSSMEEDECDDDRDDGSFILASEESAEAGDIVEEPPRKKLKRDVATSGPTSSQTEMQPPSSEQNGHCTDNFSAARAVRNLNALAASIGDEEIYPHSECLGDSLAVECYSEATTIINARSATDTNSSPDSVITSSAYRDAASQITPTVLGNVIEHISSTGDIKITLARGAAHDTGDLTNSIQNVTHHTEHILHQIDTFDEDDEKENQDPFHSTQNAHAGADPNLDPSLREVLQHTDTDVLED